MPGRRVSVFLPNLDGGGAELVTLRVAAGLAERGNRVDLVLAEARGAYLDRVPDSVRLVDLQARSPVVLTKGFALARHLRRERPEVLISALDVVDVGLLARRLARTPTRVVLTIHTHLGRQFADKPDRGVARVRRALVRTLYPRTDVLVAVSQGVADDVAAMAGVPAARVHVVPNPVVTADLLARAAEAPAHPWFAPGAPPVVLGVGRLVRQKDFATLVRAFAGVHAARPDARLVILGDADPREPAIRPELEALVAEAGLGASVDLPGFTANPYAHMARAAVFALSSAYEGFGVVLVEALATGTTVVSTDCESGPAEILDRGRYGRLVPVGDPEALGRALLDALARPDDPERLRARAQAWTVDASVARYAELCGLD